MEQLTKKHFLALEMLASGQHKYKDIAKRIGIAESTLKHWISGQPDAGTTAVLFAEEYRKLKKETDEEIETRIQRLKVFLLRRIEGWVKSLRSDQLSKENIKLVIDASRAVFGMDQKRFDPGQIYQTNLSGEDLVNEFKKLQSIADAALEKSRKQ